MAAFREAVLALCWLSPTLAGLFFWVVSLTAFMGPQSNTSSTSPSPSPSAVAVSCDPDELRTTMLTSVRWMAALAISGILLMYYARWFVETKAGTEIKEASIEDEPCKAAREELREAEGAVLVALQVFWIQSSDANRQNYLDAVGLKDEAAKKVDMCGISKEGLGRLPRCMRLWVRFVFILAIFLSFATGWFAAVAFYFSLRVQSRCMMV